MCVCVCVNFLFDSAINGGDLIFSYDTTTGKTSRVSSQIVIEDMQVQVSS